MQLILALLAGIIVFSGYLLITSIMADKKRKDLLRSRLAPDGSEYNDDQYSNQPLNLNGDPSPRAQGILKFLRSFGVDVEKTSARLERRFAQAGIASADAPAYYMLFKNVGSLVILAIAGIVGYMGYQKGNDGMMFAGVVLAIIGQYGPNLYIQNCIDKRKKILQRSFPDTLDLLLICVESGLALDAALTRVCAELGRAHPEMTGELNRTRLDLALLNDRVRALMNLGERTDMTAFRSLISALIQSERFGTSLTDTLRVLSEEFRLQRLTDAEIKAARLPVMMTIPLIFCLMPAFFLIVLGPAIVKIMNEGQEVTGRPK